MKTEKMKVLLYLKKSSLDKSGKAPIMGRITIGRSIAQFSCKLSCNPDLWNPRESRMDGKSRDAVEINGKLENLLLSIQSAYQSLIAKGCLFDATEVKEQFQGSVQVRCMLIERLDMLIKEREAHIGIDMKRESMSAYRLTRKRLQEFIQKKYNVSDLAFSQLTENFIYELQTFCLGELGYQQSTFFRVAADLKTICRLAYREGIADTSLFDKAHIEHGDKKTPKALDREALEKLKALRFDELEEEMETARDIFLFACYTGAAYCDLMMLGKKHLISDDKGCLWLKFNRQKTGVLCRIKLLPEAIRLIEKMHSDERETLLPFIKYPAYQICLKTLRLRTGISFPFTTHTARHTFATLECLVTTFCKAQNFISQLCPIGFCNDVIVHNLILFYCLLFQVFPVSIGKDNGVRTPLKAVVNSREVSGRTGKRVIRSIGSHLRFLTPSWLNGQMYS